MFFGSYLTFFVAGICI